MPACLICGGSIARRPRGLFGKIVDRAVYKCELCGLRIHRRRPLFALFRPYCECPRCGARDLHKLASRDRVDGISRNPLRRILVLFGCPIYHCTFCRFQFRDWRKRESDDRKKSRAVTA